MAYLHLVLLFIGVSLPATPAQTPTCKKINDCACTPTDTNATGVINFYPLVNSADAKPVYMVNGTSQITKDEYSFMYNPCVGFSVASGEKGSPCTHDLMCQAGIKFNLTYNLGAVSTANFAYVKDDLYVYYYSKAQHNRTSEVKLLCDQNESHGKLEFVAEPRMYYYQFTFTSMCACPGKCPNKTMMADKWVKTDRSCVYRQPWSGKVVNLQGLDSLLKITIDDYTTYYYSPCDGFELGTLDDECRGVAVCQEDASTSPPTYRGIGSKEAELNEEDGNIVLHYPGVNGGKCFNVKLVCDQTASNTELINDGDNRMILRSKNACM